MGKLGSAVASRKHPASALVSIPGAPCAEDLEVSLPPLSELQAITEMVEFREKAGDLGMVVRVLKPGGRRLVQRTKADILDDYKRELDELPAASATSERASRIVFFGFRFGSFSSDDSRIDAPLCQRWFGFFAFRN